MTNAEQRLRALAERFPEHSHDRKELAALADEVAALEAARWHTDDMNDLVLMGMARDEALAENAKLRGALKAERLDVLWNAYYSGSEKDGKWTHMFMSDGEWLASEIGLDPSLGHYDATEVKAKIPEAAERFAAQVGAGLADPTPVSPGSPLSERSLD